MALAAKQRIVEGGREARLSDRHLRLFATLSFDYQNRRRAGATELQLCRTFIGEVKICETEMGEGKWASRPTGAILDKEGSVGRFSSTVLEGGEKNVDFLELERTDLEAKKMGKSAARVSTTNREREGEGRWTLDKERQIPMLV